MLFRRFDGTNFSIVNLCCNFESLNTTTQTKQQLFKTIKNLNAMKKTAKTLDLKTDKVVSLTKAQAQSLIGGRYSDTVTTGLSRCWCRD